MAEKRSIAIIVAVIGATATIIAALIGMYSSKSTTRPANSTISPEFEHKMRAELLAEIRKALNKSPVKVGSTVTGLSFYDESYIAAVLDAMRGIAEQYEGVEIDSNTEVINFKIVKDEIEAANVVNFGKTFRLSWKSSVKDGVLTEDIIRLDVFPKPKKEPDKSFTILVKKFMVESISKDFSIKYLDHALEKEGFELKDPVHSSDGTFELTCRYNMPNSRKGHVLISKGIGVPSNKANAADTKSRAAD
ncbi:hypothetical protein ACFL0O_06785 [Thermodesulfobacteriota bacterium]